MFRIHRRRVSTSLYDNQFDLNLTCGTYFALGIDKCGCGNWKNVSEYIGTKNIKQVEEHYWEVTHKL
jgi:hypothetical protein